LSYLPVSPLNLYKNYHWKQFDGRVTFIKTTENKNWDEEVWQNLAKRGVKIIKIPGEHYRRFEEPNVIALAKLLQEELNKVYEENLKVG
jgi:thioesterase domain-containing protein